MKPIAAALKELKRTLVTTAVLSSYMDSVVVFLIVYLVMTLVNLPWYYALAPFLIYLGMHTATNLRAINYGDVESKVPSLRESLRTSADHIGTDNPVVAALHDEVLVKMREVKTSYFIQFGRTARHLFVIGLISFAIIAASAFHVRFLDAQSIVLDLKALKPVQRLTGIVPEVESGENLSDILGNESIAQLGREELKLEINPLLSDININEVKPPEEKEFKEVFPGEIEAQSAAAYEESIPK
ncbi:hypothetical protein HY642_02280, partial [Candidatus Woesearchaeota archaeon]|nr:hypothetical protein [Candidatus Woesearchaeota archaeon]